jgi:clan AA aspartic protease (TIGR02281 family)
MTRVLAAFGLFLILLAGSRPVVAQSVSGGPATVGAPSPTERGWSCPPPPPIDCVSSRMTRFRWIPGAPILVPARINGRGAVALVLDTGATMTTMSPAALARVGVPLEEGSSAPFSTVTGTGAARTAQVESIKIGLIERGPLTIAVYDGNFSGDGLLGLDFLERVTVTIDGPAGIVTLTAR